MFSYCQQGVKFQHNFNNNPQINSKLGRWNTRKHKRTTKKMKNNSPLITHTGSSNRVRGPTQCKLRQDLTIKDKGLAYTNTFLFENTLFSLRFGLRSTLRWCFCWRKWSFLKTLSKVDEFENIVFIAVWTVKTEVFESDDVCLLTWCIFYR